MFCQMCQKFIRLVLHYGGIQQPVDLIQRRSITAPRVPLHYILHSLQTVTLLTVSRPQHPLEKILCHGLVMHVNMRLFYIWWCIGSMHRLLFGLLILLIFLQCSLDVLDPDQPIIAFNEQIFMYSKLYFSHTTHFSFCSLSCFSAKISEYILKSKRRTYVKRVFYIFKMLQNACVLIYFLKM